MHEQSHKALALGTIPLAFLPLPQLPAWIGLNKVNSAIATHNDAFLGLISMRNGAESLAYLLLFCLGVYLGSTLPDLDFKFKAFMGDRRNERHLYHRQTTHSILLWVLLWFVNLAYLPHYLHAVFIFFFFGIMFGVFTHLVGDILTGSIPLLLYCSYANRFGRIGITMFLPKQMHSIFTDKLPYFLERKYKKLFYVSLVSSFCITAFILFVMPSVLN